jgi:NAD(P)-dependent dehydrogenase (short-subunit alcohol dehydrogenase family)
MSLFSLANRTALVTGASSGLGRHFAGVLAKAGATVVVAARRMDKLEEVASEIDAAGGKALPVEMDVTSGMSREGWFREQSEEDWNAVIDTNLTGVWRVGKHATNAMIDAGVKGAIVNIASITAHRTQYMTAAYCVSKAGVDHLTRHMALENARYGIRVNAISPGYYKTAINDDYLDSEAGQAMRKRIAFRRFGEYRELDGALLLLSSDAGSYMTGSTIVVDGGHLISSL